jgi:excisionase family DNA binding protein
MEYDDRLLKPSEVAEVFGVDPKTVVRWANDGRIVSVRLPSGRHRFRQSVVDAVLEADRRAGGAA